MKLSPHHEDILILPPFNRNPEALVTFIELHVHYENMESFVKNISKKSYNLEHIPDTSALRTDIVTPLVTFIELEAIH